MKQTDEEKLKRSRAFLQKLKEARGGKIMDSHRTMGNDPSLCKMFLEQYVNCNKRCSDPAEISRTHRYGHWNGNGNGNNHEGSFPLGP